MIVGTIFEVSDKSDASGHYGEVRVGKNLRNNELVAIKLEPLTSLKPQLHKEYRFYKQLGSHGGIPEIYYFGRCEKYCALVMELLGPSLKDLWKICGKKFSLKTVLMIAKKLINLLEFVHSKGIIYQDIKRQNFVVGKSANSKYDVLHIIDFGLSKEFMDPDTKKHVPQSQNGAHGSLRYMSINAMFEMEQSRRDDLESLGYMLLYLLGKKLPWQGQVSDSEKSKYQKIRTIKAATSIEDLCKNHPEELLKYFRYVKNLDFLETPDYAYLKNIFGDILERNCYEDDNVFDWIGNINIETDDALNADRSYSKSKCCLTIVGAALCELKN